MAKNIEKLYNDIFKLRDDLNDITAKAKDIADESKEFQGIINDVLTEQFVKYFIPGINAYISNEGTKGGLAGIVKFLDNVPLAYTRDKSEPDMVDPMIPDTQIQAPAGSNLTNIPNDTDKIPLNTSYRKPQGEEVAPTNPVRPSRDI